MLGVEVDDRSEPVGNLWLLQEVRSPVEPLALLTRWPFSCSPLWQHQLLVGVSVTELDERGDDLFELAVALARVSAFVPVVWVGTEVVDVGVTWVPLSCRSAVGRIDLETKARHRPDKFSVRALLFKHGVEGTPRSNEVIAVAEADSVSGFGLVMERDPHVWPKGSNISSQLHHLIVDLRAGASVCDRAPGDLVPVVTGWIDRQEQLSVAIDDPVIQAIIEVVLPRRKRASDLQLGSELTLELLIGLNLCLTAFSPGEGPKENAIV